MELKRVKGVGKKYEEEMQLPEGKELQPSESRLRMFTLSPAEIGEMSKKTEVFRREVAGSMKNMGYSSERVDDMQLSVNELLCNVLGHHEFCIGKSYSATYNVNPTEARVTIKWRAEQDFDFRSKALEEAIRDAELQKNPAAYTEDIMRRMDRIEELKAEVGNGKVIGGIGVGMRLTFNLMGYSFDGETNTFQESSKGKFIESYDSKKKEKTVELVIYKEDVK